MSKHSRPASLLDRIDAHTIPDIREVVRMAREKFNPPQGWDLRAAPYSPPKVEVTVTVAEGLAYLAEHHARQIGVTPENYMSALLSEALDEALMRVGRQINPYPRCRGPQEKNLRPCRSPRVAG
jgi:hypothetical protein